MLGERIKEARTARQLSQQDLAEIINTTQSQIARWESAKSLNSSVLSRIAHGLGLTMRDLLDNQWPEDQACACCNTLLVWHEWMRLGAHPGTPRFCNTCVKTRTAECLAINDKALEVLNAKQV